MFATEMFSARRAGASACVSCAGVGTGLTGACVQIEDDGLRLVEAGDVVPARGADAGAIGCKLRAC